MIHQYRVFQHYEDEKIEVSGDVSSALLRYELFLILKRGGANRHYRIQHTITSFQYAQFKHCFSSWDQVDESNFPAIHKIRAKTLSSSFQEAQRADVLFVECRKITPGSTFDSWATFSDFSSKGFGANFQLETSLKFVCEAFVFFEFHRKRRVHKHKIIAYLSTALLNSSNFFRGPHCKNKPCLMNHPDYRPSITQHILDIRQQHYPHLHKDHIDQ